MTSSTRAIQVTNDQGVTFLVRLVQPGEAYGRNNCLNNESDDMLVEFYDTRYAHLSLGLFVSRFTAEEHKGQFVSRYYAKTLLEGNFSTGLRLEGGVPAWELSAKNAEAVKAFLAENCIAAAD